MECIEVIIAAFLRETGRVGTLDEAARLTRGWFERHLVRARHLVP